MKKVVNFVIVIQVDHIHRIVIKQLDNVIVVHMLADDVVINLNLVILCHYQILLHLKLKTLKQYKVHQL